MIPHNLRFNEVDSKYPFLPSRSRLSLLSLSWIHQYLHDLEKPKRHAYSLCSTIHVIPPSQENLDDVLTHIVTLLWDGLLCSPQTSYNLNEIKNIKISKKKIKKIIKRDP